MVNILCFMYSLHKIQFIAIFDKNEIGPLQRKTYNFTILKCPAYFR